MCSSIPTQALLPVEAPASDRRLTAAVVLAGICTFLQVYATQPLLPMFRRVFSASELQVSFTVSAVTLAVAIAAPFVGAVADFVGRKAVIVPAILGLSIPTALTV